jgi:hypothetical protein
MPPPVPAQPEEDAEHTTPALPDEMLEQIFLRLPRDEPACLVRASLTSKLWLDILTGPGFRSRYREHHGAPRMLGFLDSSPWDSWEPEEGDPTVPPFVSTTGFCARVPDGGWGHRGYNAWDCSLGFAQVDRLTLCLWSRCMGSSGATSWPRSKVINLKSLQGKNLWKREKTGRTKGTTSSLRCERANEQEISNRRRSGLIPPHETKGNNFCWRPNRSSCFF